MRVLLFFISFFYFTFSYGQFSIEDYTLIWSDEFEKEQLDKTKWRYKYLNQKRRLAFNRKENVDIENGKLILKTTQQNDSIFTGFISTLGNFQTTYGYFECKVKFQDEPGHWSAFWLQNAYTNLEDNIPTEIDVFEYLPNKPKKIQHAVHVGSYDENLDSYSCSYKRKAIKKEDWHTIGLVWTPKYYTFIVDGIPKSVCEVNHISKNPKYIVLSLEVGDWAGKIKKATLPDSVEFEYVRVYKKVVK